MVMHLEHADFVGHGSKLKIGRLLVEQALLHSRNNVITIANYRRHFGARGSNVFSEFCCASGFCRNFHLNRPGILLGNPYKEKALRRGLTMKNCIRGSPQFASTIRFSMCTDLIEIMLTSTWNSLPDEAATIALLVGSEIRKCCKMRGCPWVSTVVDVVTNIRLTASQGVPTFSVARVEWAVWLSVVGFPEV